MNKHKTISAIAIVSVIVLGLGVTVFYLVVPGLSVARQEPSTLEIEIATWLLKKSVPEEARKAVNPLDPDSDGAVLTAGAEMYKEDCESCHGYDGGGETEIGSGLFPRAPSLRSKIESMTDGEIFYHIRNGIRNTGMPAWDKPDQQIWQLVAYLRSLPITAPLTPDSETESQQQVANASYVGSASCQECHRNEYDRWSNSRMANIVVDPRLHPEVVLPDFSVSDPLVTFTLGDVDLVYGSGWKQRYFTKVGDDYYVQPAQWDVTHEVWRRYFAANGGDWWTEFYPPDNFQRPTGPLCDGCHSVNYDISNKSVTEWNVGCERCHGPGSSHVASQTSGSIINPAHMDYVHANDTCIQCHSQGQPLSNPIAGQYYDWPVGYDVGKNLWDYWKLEEHKLGETTFTHFADGTAHKNRMQGNDFVQSLMYARGVTCFTCHDPHGSDENPASLRMPVNEICMTCHGPNSQSGPHSVSIEAHTHHSPDSAGSECISCHMPKIARTISDVSVSSHTFRFVTPNETESLGIPNACNVCHTDKDTGWASAALAGWEDRSPWRMLR